MPNNPYEDAEERQQQEQEKQLAKEFKLLISKLPQRKSYTLYHSLMELMKELEGTQQTQYTFSLLEEIKKVLYNLK